MTSFESRFSRQTNYLDSKLHILLYLAHPDEQFGGQSDSVSVGKCVSSCSLHAHYRPHRGGEKPELTVAFRTRKSSGHLPLMR